MFSSRTICNVFIRELESSKVQIKHLNILCVKFFCPCYGFLKLKQLKELGTEIRDLLEFFKYIIVTQKLRLIQTKFLLSRSKYAKSKSVNI